MRTHLPTAGRSPGRRRLLRLLDRPPWAGRSGERGSTLIELMAATAISVMVIGVMVSMVTATSKSNRDTLASAQSSTSTFDLNAYFAEDASSTGPVSGASEIQRGKAGCGTGTSFVRFVGPGAAAGTVTIRAYAQGTKAGLATLERRVCTAASVAAASAATPRVQVLVPDLKAGSVGVACDDDAAGAAARLSADQIDASCHIATMIALTTTERSLVAVGETEAVASPTPTTSVTAVRAPATGSCTLLASQTSWGATGGAAGSNSATHGSEAEMDTYDDTNQMRSFVKFDLTSPCQGPTPDWPTLPGGRTLTSVKLQLAYLGKSNGHCWIFPGISYDGQVLQALDTGSTWTEAGLTGANMPGALRGSSYQFNVGSAGALTTHANTAITDAVNGWYLGTWVNNGFRISRSSVGDTCSDSNRFASRHAANPALAPRLVITWG